MGSLLIMTFILALASVAIVKPKIYLVLTFIYTVFEVVILNALPYAYLFGLTYVALVRFSFEIMAWLSAAFLLVQRLQTIKLAKHDFLIIAFCVVTLFASMINNVGFNIMFMGLRWIIRAVPIYYIVKWGGYTKKDIENFMGIFFKVACIQAVIALAQFFFRSQMDLILVPNFVLGIEDVAGFPVQRDVRFAIFSTFGRFGLFGNYIILVLCFSFAKVLTGEKNKKYIALLSVYSIIVLLSFSRQAVVAFAVAAFLAMLLYYGKSLSKKLTIIMLASFIPLIILFIIAIDIVEMGTGLYIDDSILQRFFTTFSSDFIMRDFHAQARTWFSTVALWRLISTRPLFGYGLGMFATQPAIAFDQSVHILLDIPTQYSMDVYFVSIIGQTGLIGFFLLMLIYFHQRNRAKWLIKNKADKENNFYHYFTYMSITGGLVQMFFGTGFSDRFFATAIWAIIGFHAVLTANYKKESQNEVEVKLEEIADEKAKGLSHRT